MQEALAYVNEHCNYATELSMLDEKRIKCQNNMHV